MNKSLSKNLQKTDMNKTLVQTYDSMQKKKITNLEKTGIKYLF